MAISTNLISGLSSGFDWRSMIDQLIAIDHRSVDLIETRKSDYETKLTEWQSFNTKLLDLKTSSEALKDTDDFYLYSSTLTTDSSTVDGEDLLSVSTTTSAAVGSYSIKVTNLAQAQKLSSSPFASKTAELGSSYAGDMIINGKALSVAATDTLTDVAYNINSLNTGVDPSGVTATVVKYGGNDYRLVLTSDTTGADGMSLLNGSSTNLVQKFGWKDNGAATIKNSITNGAQSDLFTAQNVTIKSLLGLGTGEASTGTLTIGGTAVTINLATKSLTGIKTAINDAAIPGVTASVVSETVDGTEYYRLQIEGTQSFVDEKNILNTLGILDHSSPNVAGEVSGNSMTTNGAYITTETLLTDIDGYISFTGGDNILMEGTKTGGAAVNYTFNISSSTTVADLLSAMETQYSTASGDAVAYLTSDGKIRVDDVAGGGSLSVKLTDNITSGQLEFVALNGFFGNADPRARQIVGPENATVEVDGVEVSSESNTIDDVITGVTLNLLKIDAATITLTIDHDIEAIKSGIADFVAKYDTVMSYINSQFAYDGDSEETGGPLFGDGTLSSVKSDLTSLLTENIWGVDSDFSILGLVGITVDNDLILGIDDAKLTGYLETNFNDIMSLFVGQGVPSNSTLSYIGHADDSQAGEYTVHIDTAATQATATGSVDLTGGASDNATLTVSQGNNTAAITITAGMLLADIKNTINQEFDAIYEEVLVGDQQVMSGGSPATAQTEWADITGTTFVNGDIISFTGTNRSGAGVSGAYTITNVGTDTIQGFLSAVESAFSSDVTANIDTSGRLVLTDKFSGSSQLSLTVPVTKGLDFGNVDITAGAGDGSQEGRYAMALTADDDGSGHLVIRSNDYGSTSFSISQDDPLVLGLTDGSVAGQDVAGTINGEAATGSGQVLTGNDGNANTAGLSVRYSGTSNNVDAGEIKLTLGVAELFNRILESVTDSVDGYGTFKEQSLQDSINGFETQIEEMEARLERKTEAMINRFVAMELALSKMQSISNWLTGQISAANSGWT